VCGGLLKNKLETDIVELTKYVLTRETENEKVKDSLKDGDVDRSDI
jgi:hypothetical protein